MTHVQILISVSAVLFVFVFIFSVLTVLLVMFAAEDKKRLLLVLKAKLPKRRGGRIRR